MKTTDFIAKVTAENLNESMFKKFGTKINFNKYTREELENYRNILRTKVHQTETGSKFNDLLSNENYQRDKHMLELLNTKIKEMLGEGAKVDRQAKHITKSMMKAHPGMSHDEAEAAAWAHIKHPKKKKKAKEGIEETTMKTTEGKKKGDGNLANNYPPYDKVTRGDVVAGRLGKDAKGGKKVKETNDGNLANNAKPYDKVTRGDVIAGRLGKDAQGGKKVKEAFPTVADARARAEKAKGTGKFDKKETPTGTVYTRKSSTFSDGGDDSDTKKAKKKMKESYYKLHVRLVNESLKYLIREDEEGKAKAITAASDMVNDFTTWMQRVGQYQTKAIVELADAIRADFGEQEAEVFKQTVSPALAATLDTLTQQREAISHAVAVLAGEATNVPQMGAEPGMDAGMEAPPEMAPADSMNPPEDEFGASDAAAGGAEAAGREVRESRIRRIAESHSIISRLAR